MTGPTPFAVPARRPDDVRPHLGSPGTHWRDGRSAKELARAWIDAGRVPAAPAAVLATAAPWRDAELVHGVFEHAVDLGTRGRASQTDLLAIVGLGDRLGIIGVEGKVDESFGPRVADWRDGGAGKEARLARLADDLALEIAATGGLRYQLLHRTASALYEAQRWRAAEAMMLVHSFCPRHSGLDDLGAFASALGLDGPGPGGLVGPVERVGVALWLGWAADAPAPA
jgi:hypothetical protein